MYRKAKALAEQGYLERAYKLFSDLITKNPSGIHTLDVLYPWYPPHTRLCSFQRLLCMNRNLLDIKRLTLNVKKPTMQSWRVRVWSSLPIFIPSFSNRFPEQSGEKSLCPCLSPRPIIASSDLNSPSQCLYLHILMPNCVGLLYIELGNKCIFLLLKVFQSRQLHHLRIDESFNSESTLWWFDDSSIFKNTVHNLISQLVWLDWNRRELASEYS